MAQIRVWAAALLLAGLIGLSGCTSGHPFAEVEGVVTKDGKTLDNIRVEFWPENNGPRSMGTTDASGRYSLTSDDGNRLGAMVGPHRVVLRDKHMYGDKIVGRQGENMELSGGKKDRLPAGYGDAHKTPLKKSVTDGQKNVIDLDVK